MDKRLDRIEDKLDKVLEKVADQAVTLAKQSVILEDHVKRTNLLEDRLSPIEMHVAKIEGAWLVIKKLAKISIPLLFGAGSMHGVLHWLLKLY